MSENAPSVIIIGAGIAGLSAGVYAQANGFQTRIYELHSQPGGLMTSWKRKGYTIDGCIHWLTGSAPGAAFYTLWEEIGLIQNREIFNPEVFSRMEGPDGKVLKIYANADKLEQHLLELAPEDAAAIKEMCKTVRICSRFDPPAAYDTGLAGLGRLLRSLPGLAMAMPRLGKLMPMTIAEYTTRFKNAFLREALNAIWFEKMSAAALLMTLGWLHSGQAGYPIGGSLPMARAVEKRFCDLGGEIHYNSRVEKIVVENHTAVGVKLADGRVERADYIISAADGYNTLFKMLNDKYVTPEFKGLYEKGEIFPPLLFIGLGVSKKMDDPELYGITGGQRYHFDDPIEIAGEPVRMMDLMIYNFDPTLSPEGKTVITLMHPTSYSYWKELAEEPERYQAEKERIALEYIQRLDRRFPGLAGQVEMADVATPLTFEHYTGNWQGSFEGWLPTPSQMMKGISKTLPGLANFYMVGQWVQAGGGLPSGVTTGRQVVQMICKDAGKRFRGKGTGKKRGLGG